MAEEITIRWAGPSDATSDSYYRIERTLDWSSWTELVATKMATEPYSSPFSVLASNTTYGATSITLANAAAFSATGYGWIDDALIQWTDKSSNTLTGVVWHSGYGTYASGTPVYEAHEKYQDTTTPTNLAVVYRVTHIDAASRESPPTYFWFFYPPAPASRDHCVVIVQVGADLGMEMKSGVMVQAYLGTDDQFALIAGTHLDQKKSAMNVQMTDNLGLAAFQCWKSRARGAIGSDVPSGPYIFVLGTPPDALTVRAATIPDRDWVLLKDIGE